VIAAQRYSLIIVVGTTAADRLVESRLDAELFEEGF